MPFTSSFPQLLGGRLSLDFVNATPSNAVLSWEHLIHFLESTSVVSAGRGAQLLSLPQSDPQAAEALLLNAQRLASALPTLSPPIPPNQNITAQSATPLNKILP